MRTSKLSIMASTGCSIALSDYTITLTKYNSLVVRDGNETVVNNVALLADNLNTTAKGLKNITQGLSYNFITPTVAKVTLNTSSPFHGAIFTADEDAHFYGVWEYPFNNQMTNKGVSPDLKGVQFIFNTTSLVYYIILPNAKNDFKSIIEQYTELSARSEMPPTSGLCPTFWYDDFTQDFHGRVSNAQENVYDIVNHGNFDFDPKFYPDPEGFIKNLTEWGFDFQVWIANRATANKDISKNTKLWNVSTENDWLFPRIVEPIGALGPALNLSILAAYDYFEKGLEYFPSVGVKGYKIDRGEEGEMPDYVQNEQMALFLQLAYDTMVQKWGSSNFYNFARSAVDRSRAVTHIWNSDSHANFTALAYSVASGIRSGLIAFPIWGSDTGGYTREGGALSPTEEVWARWMVFSAFSPVYELMLGTNHTPWYPPYTNQTLSVLQTTANLHADLIPYIKSYAYAASQTGLPVIRALFLEAPSDRGTWEANDGYFFGEEFLVAPIVNEGGRRSVYFPKGRSKKYLNYFKKRDIHNAGTTTNVSLGVNSMPVYVTRGAVIPLFLSWDIPESKFTYFTGEGAKGKTAVIKMTTNKDKRTVRVEYEDLGVGAAVLICAGGGSREVNLNRGGGFTEVGIGDTLFERA
ncbi:glycoside hydrolase family 31 protein [Zopfia rhizophila CBS 207.26]|uniref:Glycoside hydrolase family 31 protein n=1 Tax=Zopfia rhizophila CBS 207.26 TaxID=1314779 RepID=A0A6A6EED5_9PEZI|nr:glycoside hydrolase family 31 protein [Zopfia rhizophila CBS 207.26]